MTDKSDIDIKLMLDFKNGDEDAFNTLLVKYSSPIINFIYRFTGNRHIAEELAQEVFLRVYRSKETYQPKSKFSTWLYTIATNTSLDYKKKSKRDLCGQAESLTYKTEDDEDGRKEIPDKTEKPVELSVEQGEADAKVRLALASLPDNQRLAITLKIYEDKSYKEISEILGCSIPSVESLIFRARQYLKNKYGVPR